ncbi:uncharacterized protein LOC120902191 [Anopheles arabiensis]|uniref:Chitin-binding type-2 domain-containing protein n=3 Tax=gambiae species complex TaxID=44542 RepID=A0A1S4H8Z5_ANOGA|nr:uncharacterized protein LOC120902191 [Anopheles arabiensis]
MRLQAEHLVMLMLVTYGAVECLDVICQIQLQLPIESALAKELRSCSVFIVNSVSFDIDQSTILSQEELARIDTIKRSNASADVLLTIVLPFNVTVQSVHRQLSERIGIVLRDNVLDGVDLDYDIALLDHYEQHRYGQFLRQLRTALSDKYRISTTIGCHTLGSSKALLTAFNDQLDLVSVVGVNMLEDELLNRSAEELLVREYEAEYIERLVSGGLRPEKIVLSVLTVGVVFNPGSYRAVRSLHRSLQVGVLAYGQVCELLRERQAKCGDGSKRPTCSLFAGRAAVVYDSETTVRLRTEQAHRLAARGVLILPNYDDTDNRCGAGPFPLFRSLMEGVKEWTASESSVLVCDGKQRYGDAADRLVYYTFYNGRFQQHRCAAGTHFNEQLQACVSTREVARTEPKDTECDAAPLSEYSSTPVYPPSTDSSTTTTTTTLSAVVKETIAPNTSTPTRSVMQSLESALTYLDGIIYRALGMVERLENLEQSHQERTQTKADYVIPSTVASVAEQDHYAAEGSSLVEETVTTTAAAESSTLLEGLLIPAGLPYFR